MPLCSHSRQIRRTSSLLGVRVTRIMKEQEARVYQPSYAQHLSVPGLEIAAGSPLHSYSRTASDHHASRVSKSSGGADCGHSRFKSHSPVHFKPEMNDGGVRASSTKAVPMPPPPGPFSPRPRGHQRAYSESSLSPKLSVSTALTNQFQSDKSALCPSHEPESLHSTSTISLNFSNVESRHQCC